MSFRIPVTPYNRDQLEALANPISAQQPEALVWTFWDTLTFTSASTTTLTFFQTVNTDKTLGNIQQQGSLPDPQYFQMFNVGLDVLRDVTTTASAATTGAVDDVQKLVLTQRGRAVLTISGKPYMDVPTSFLHCSGGATGFGWATMTAQAQTEFANNSIPDGGYNLMGKVVIPPKQAFDITLSWPAAITLTANVSIRVWVAGVLFRRVL